MRILGSIFLFFQRRIKLQKCSKWQKNLYTILYRFIVCCCYTNSIHTGQGVHHHSFATVSGISICLHTFLCLWSNLPTEYEWSCRTSSHFPPHDTDASLTQTLTCSTSLFVQVSVMNWTILNMAGFNWVDLLKIPLPTIPVITCMSMSDSKPGFVRMMTYGVDNLQSADVRTYRMLRITPQATNVILHHMLLIVCIIEIVHTSLQLYTHTHVYTWIPPHTHVCGGSRENIIMSAASRAFLTMCACNRNAAYIHTYISVNYTLSMSALVALDPPTSQWLSWQNYFASVTG